MSYAHWDAIFDTTDETRLGWYESDTSLTWKMLEPVGPADDRTVFLAGIGTSGLADEMADAGWSLVLNDLSPVALSILESRLPAGADAQLVDQSIADPLPQDVPKVDLWVDRAALHFLTNSQDIEGYFQNLRNQVKPGGYVLLAEFAPDGAHRCAGLPVHRYSLEEMQERLGEDFETVDSQRYLYRNPKGDPRPYVYGLFRRGGD
jgi:SAM-dependent methyltransferase